MDWERAEAIRRMISDNFPTSRHHGAPKHGDALLAGLLRCRRCGRKLVACYTGTKHNIPRYACHRGRLDSGEPNCIAFGGLRVDNTVAAALLQVVEPGAIAAAVAAEAEAADREDQVRAALLRDLEAARYAAERAFRQYDAADPANRLVAGELEARWNTALGRVAEVEFEDRHPRRGDTDAHAQDAILLRRPGRESRGHLVRPRHVLCNRGLPDIDAELEQFAVDARRTPQRVGNAHLVNKVANLGWSTRPPAP